MSNPPTDIREILTQALQLHQAGDAARAEPLYRRALEIQPEHPEALHLLGVLYHQCGHPAQGVDFVRRSVELMPTFINVGNHGEILRVLGKHDHAIEQLRRAVEMNPNWADTHGNLGMAYLDTQKFDDAVKSLSRACELAPNRGDLFIRLCRAQDRQGDPYSAIRSGLRAVELLPQSSEAWSNLSLAQISAKKADDAIKSANRAIELAPNRVEPYVNIGVVLAGAEKFQESAEAYEKATQIDPNYALAHRNKAAMYDRLERPDKAIPPLRRSLELMPNDVDGWINLSSLSRRMKDYQQSLMAVDQALKLQPNNPGAHGSRGFALLFLGDYQGGFSEYEWRWRCDNFTTPVRTFTGAVWDGSDPTGRTILVHSEQGFGDSLQFARYVPMLAERGAKVIFETWASTRHLMARVKGVTKVIVSGVRPPEFDWHIPLLSLPKIFGTTVATIPGNVPYLDIDPERIAAWKEKIAALGSDMKVGLIWAGNLKPDPGRTCPIEYLAPLAKIPGVTFVSLQKRSNPQGEKPPPAGMKFVDMSEELTDFTETGAAMMNLDLIITIDSAAAHLAGGLARPTWTLLPWAADWRWLEDREDSPWYPTMRLFRQKVGGDWRPVGEQVAAELEKLVKSSTR